MREIRRASIDLPSIERQNRNQKHLISFYRKRLKLIDEDKDRKKRLAKSQCKVCYYQDSRIGGAACTSQQCGLCEGIMHFGNTCTDVLCRQCATENGLCEHCGADIGYVNKRKRKLPEPSVRRCGDCYKPLTTVRPGKHVCENPECIRNEV